MSRKQLTTLLGYSLIHGVMDFSGIALIWLSSKSHALVGHDILILTVLYTLLAFGTQPLFGLLVDKLRVSYESVLIGVLLMLSAFFLFATPALVVIFAGLGSALFHIGAGSMSLDILPQKNTPPGIFSAFGILGLTSGIVVGTAGVFYYGLHLALLLLAVVFVLFTPITLSDVETSKKMKNIPHSKLIITLLLIAIAIRAVYGLGTVFMWESHTVYFLALALAVAVGKISGAIFADRYSWLKTIALSVFIAIPIVVFFANIYLAALVGTFLFSFAFAMPLVALSNMLAGRKAFVFGLVEFMILFQYVGGISLISQPWLALPLLIFSTVALLLALRLLSPYFKKTLNITN